MKHIFGMNRKEEDPVADAFIEDIVRICDKHGLTLGHEDSQGGFRVLDYDLDNITWLRQASVDREDAPSKATEVKDVMTTGRCEVGAYSPVDGRLEKPPQGGSGAPETPTVAALKAEAEVEALKAKLDACCEVGSDELEHLPDGYKPVVAFGKGDKVVIPGEPPEHEEETTPEDERHNCDENGCGWWHIIGRCTVKGEPWLREPHKTLMRIAARDTLKEVAPKKSKSAAEILQDADRMNVLEGRQLTITIPKGTPSDADSRDPDKPLRYEVICRRCGKVKARFAFGEMLDNSGCGPDGYELRDRAVKR